MSKQEVIGIICEALDIAWVLGWGDCKIAPRHPVRDYLLSASELYDRIAPLREFPEERLRGLLADKDLWTEEGLLYQIRLLFEGEPPSIFDPSGDAFISPRPTVGGNTPEQERQDDINKATNKARGKVLAKIAQDKPKGTCGKCGGSGEIQERVGSANNLILKPCPDCGGTGECQHKNVEKRPIAGPSHPLSAIWDVWCLDCQQYVEERRSGDERREGSLLAEVVGKPLKLYFYGWDDTAGQLETWKTDLRTRTRRKAPSDDAQKARTWPHSRR